MTALERLEAWLRADAINRSVGHIDMVGPDYSARLQDATCPLAAYSFSGEEPTLELAIHAALDRAEGVKP